MAKFPSAQLPPGPPRSPVDWSLVWADWRTGLGYLWRTLEVLLRLACTVSGVLFGGFLLGAWYSADDATLVPLGQLWDFLWKYTLLFGGIVALLYILVAWPRMVARIRGPRLESGGLALWHPCASETEAD